MKDIRKAAEHYDVMHRTAAYAKEAYVENPSEINLWLYDSNEQSLEGFRLGLRCAGILEEVETEWRRIYGDV